MNTPNFWSRILIVLGGLSMLVGAVDPMEGSVLILPGSGLFAIGTYLARDDRRSVAFRVWMFLLIAFGVAALWGLTLAGGVGGTSGRSIWWAALVLWGCAAAVATAVIARLLAWLRRPGVPDPAVPAAGALR